MTVSHKELTKEIQNEFPRVTKPHNYADLILEGKRLNATNKPNAVKRRKFLESQIISASTFNSAYTKIGLLESLPNVDKTFAVSSTRHAGLSFSSSLTLSYLNYERYYLYRHIVRNPQIKKIVCMVLRMPMNTSMDAIQRRIESGHVINQVSLYRQIYEKIKRMESVDGYKWMGVVTIPAIRYYLSDLSNSLLRKVR